MSKKDECERHLIIPDDKRPGYIMCVKCDFRMEEIRVLDEERANPLAFRVESSIKTSQNEEFPKSQEPQNGKVALNHDYVTAQELRIQHAVSCAVELVGPESWKRCDTKQAQSDFRAMIKEEAKNILTICEELKDER